jgi:hypothetical protein
VPAVTLLANIADADPCSGNNSHTVTKQKTIVTCCTVPTVFLQPAKVISFYVPENKAQHLLDINKLYESFPLLFPSHKQMKIIIVNTRVTSGPAVQMQIIPNAKSKK